MGKNAGLIRIRVLFEGGSLSRIYGMYNIDHHIISRTYLLLNEETIKYFPPALSLSVKSNFENEL